MTLTDIDADLIEPQRLAECVIDQLKIERRKSPADTRHGLSAREALIALQFEAQLIAVAAHSLSQGFTLSAHDLARLLVAWARVEAILEGAGV